MITETGGASRVTEVKGKTWYSIPKRCTIHNHINTTEEKIKKEDQEVIILLRRVEVIIIFETATGKVKLLRVY